MWFLFACPENCREILLDAWNRSKSQENAERVFCLTADRVRRYEGSWHLERVNLFPRYVICDSDDPERLKDKLLSLADRLKINTDGATITVTETDQSFLERLYKGSESFQMSRGVICNGVTHVQEGPLQGWEQNIRKIDRHKRIAFLKSPDETSELVAKVGLEITEKT